MRARRAEGAVLTILFVGACVAFFAACAAVGHAQGRNVEGRISARTAPSGLVFAVAAGLDAPQESGIKAGM
jgi:hypothetical protein